MAKKRNPAAASAEPAPAPRASAVPWVLAAMMFLAPAVGVPNELMLQDTLKSIVVSFAALGAAMLFFWENRKHTEPLRWHVLVWLPLALMAYALGSMAWSHQYLGGVEAVRWFIFALLLWLALNTLTRERMPWLAWGIHGGALVASSWAALQFWGDLQLFPQGPNPGSTFVNRNFFAEFAVCTLPFGAWLVLRARNRLAVTLLAASTGFVVTTIMMTGTRAALLAMWLLLFAVLPLVIWRCRAQLAWGGWPVATRVLALGAFVGTVILLGVFPTGNTSIAQEHRVEQRGMTALERGIRRTESIRPSDHSLGLRMQMWKATTRIVEARPLAGVGAGAWEVELPRYQEGGLQLETDYYVHNEFLQLVAEYGLAGWAFLVALLGYLTLAAWRTWKLAGTEHDSETPLRAIALASLFALMVVSNVGFPWRMAATGALFALCLGVLAASDVRLGLRGRMVQAVPWHKDDGYLAMGVTFACIALAVFITERAAEAENRIVRAARLAVTISSSSNPNDPQWNRAKEEMLALIRDGTRLNPHYRKITPMVADELAKWGDWKNAQWIWESVLSSRPNVVAIIANVGRAHAVQGDLAKALEYVERAKRLQPRAPAVRSLEVIVLGRSGREADALKLARQSLDEGIFDYDLTNGAFLLATRARDWELARRAIEIRMREYPDTRLQGLMQLGRMYGEDVGDTAKALSYFRQLLAAAPPNERATVLAVIPPAFRAQAQAPQTSASSK